MHGQFRKGFRQNSKAGQHDVQTIKLGSDKIQLSWDIEKPTPHESKSKKASTSITIKRV